MFGIKNRSQFLNAISNGSLVALRNEEGPSGMAVASTYGRNRGRYLDKPFDAQQWVTNTYIKEKLVWKCVMTEEAPVLA